MAGEGIRTASARALAERALAELLRRVGEQRSKDLVVIGGLTPETLSGPNAPPHLGTVDVDIAVRVGVKYDRDELDFGWLETALKDAGFTPRTGGWRWRTTIDGRPIVLELLCDVDDNRDQEIALPGSDAVTAKNLAGPAPAAEGAVNLVTLNHGDLGFRVQFATLGTYLLTKAGAVVRRGAVKDYYDLMYVILYNAEGGPRAAGAAAATAVPKVQHHDHRLDMLTALNAYESASSDGATIFAQEMASAGPDADPAVLRQDAVTAAAQFRAAFDQY